MELYSHVSKNFAPIFSNNLSFDILPYGIPFLNRIKNLKLNGKAMQSNDQLIKVATNQYVIDNLSLVGAASYGLIKIVPKDNNGNPLKVFPEHEKEYQLLIDSFKSE